MIYIYTDGSVTKPTEGKSPGGWAFCYSIGDDAYRGSGGCRMVTSNQMEMIAVIKGLQSLLRLGLEGEDICVVSDSQYVIHGCSKWIIDWKRTNWCNSRGRSIKNKEHWKQIDFLAGHFKSRWKWIRGHNGHPDNELCDKLARAAAFRTLGMLEAAS